MNYQYHVLGEQEVYRGFFKIRRFTLDIEYFDGTRSGALVRECSGVAGFVVAVLPYDPVRQEIVLVEQFRIGAMVAGAHPWQLEVVAGFMDKAEETAAQCVARELYEEIGTTAKRLEYVQTYFGSPGGSAGQTHLFFAEIDAETVAPFTGLREEGEDIRVLRFSYQEIFKRLQEGKLNNSTLLLAVQAFYLRYLKT